MGFLHGPMVPPVRTSPGVGAPLIRPGQAGEVTMSPTLARAVSMALLGGLAAALLSWLGLLYWAAILAWGCFLVGGGDRTALQKTVAGSVLGAFLGWAALMIMFQVHVPADSWLWMPRLGIAVAVTLFFLGLASKVELLSHVPAALAGYAAVISAVFYVRIPDLPILGRMTGLHMYNPFIAVVLSMVAGAVVGLIAVRLAGTMSKK